MRDAAAAATLLIILGGLGLLRPAADRQAPDPLPAASCTVWMADAVPGVGPKSREQVAARIRGGEVPPAARDWFVSR